MKASLLFLSCTILISVAAGELADQGYGTSIPQAAPNAVIGPPGQTALYSLKEATAVSASVVRTFTLTLGNVDVSRHYQWISLSATKANGEQFRVFLLSSDYPPEDLQAARSAISRYMLQEGTSPAREYRNALTGDAVLPTIGGWDYLFPRPASGAPAGEPFPAEVRYLGRLYHRESLAQSAVRMPADVKVVELRPDLLIGQYSNQRQKDETRRYDNSDYQYIKLTRDDYVRMAQAGINCVQVNAEQAPWADELGLYYWGAVLKFPESLYRSQYLGPALFLDEPAVGTRDYVLRPRLAKDPAFRRAITPQIAFEAFRLHYAEALQGAPFAMMRELEARNDVPNASNTGTALPGMHFAQQNLFSWETMVATCAYELSQDAHVPEAFVFEPPGRIGTRRTLPEINMTYGVQLRPDDPEAFTDIIFGFLRGAARVTDKTWGVSIYGQVQREDSPWWLTHAYDLGATRFFFWDNAGLAAVPFGEVLTLAHHLRSYAEMHPRRNLRELTQSAQVAVLLPPGYGLGHVYTGRGPLWGLHELNLERINRYGVTYRTVMSNFFVEIERCVKLGVDFDLLWDLPSLQLTGYHELVHIRENGKVEVDSADHHAVLAGPRVPPRTPGAPPELKVTLSASPVAEGVEFSALAQVEETSARVYYTFGTAPDGVEYNEVVAWELYGPQPEDHQFLNPENHAQAATRHGRAWEVRVKFKLVRPGSYRLRAATVDTAGRSSVVWKNFSITPAALQR